jgi:AcrR family transcriptional regulator
MCIIQDQVVGQVNKSQKPRRARRAREPEGSTRERILAAALEVFAEQGFDGARTRDIAERAGANLGLLTYYFGGKPKLWQAAVASAFRELQDELGEAVAPAEGGAAADERARLEGVLRRFVHFVARRPAFMRLMND